MKLWLKVSIISIAVLLAVMTGCSAAMLVQSQNSIIDMTIAHAKNKQAALESSFSSMARYYIPSDAKEAALYAMIVYCFSQFADEGGVLLCDGETLVSQVSIQAETLLPMRGIDNPEEQLVYSSEVDGRNILIVGGKTALVGHEYTLYVVEDISTVYNGIFQMMGNFAMMVAAGLAVGTVLIIALVRRVSAPLARLGKAARQIAGGDYTNRADVHVHDEVGWLAADFNRMAEAVEAHVRELEETARRQQLFIAGVTHEFKTPLTSLMLHADTLLNTKLNKDESGRSLNHIYNQCAWLERLTQKMLKLITTQTAISLEAHSVEALFSEVAQSTKETLSERGLSLETKCDGSTLPMDFDLMRALLVNLVDNASKASKSEQSIKLLGYGHIIEVCDEGIGIRREDISRVTEPFYMVDRSRNKKKGGSGLGLALVKQIAEAHGARLVIESELGFGTSVKIIFAESELLKS